MSAGLQASNLLNCPLLADACVTCQFAKYGPMLHVLGT